MTVSTSHPAYDGDSDRNSDGDDDYPWGAIASHRELLERIVEDDMPYAQYAKKLLDELDRRGYTAGDSQ